jgi:hypothetical protein
VEWLKVQDPRSSLSTERKKKKKEEEEILRAARSTWLSIGQDWPGDHGGNPERAPECFRSSGDE